MKTSPLPEYVTPAYLAALRLRCGCGSGAEGDRCAIQERRAWDGLDPSSDACPPADDPVIVRLVIQLNDRREDWRREVALRLPWVRGSRRSRALMLRRAFRCPDWAIHEAAPDAPSPIALLDELLRMR